MPCRQGRDAELLFLKIKLPLEEPEEEEPEDEPSSKPVEDVEVREVRAVGPKRLKSFGGCQSGESFRPGTPLRSPSRLRSICQSFLEARTMTLQGRS